MIRGLIEMLFSLTALFIAGASCTNPILLLIIGMLCGVLIRYSFEHVSKDADEMARMVVELMD